MSLRIGPTTVIGPASQEITHPTDSGASHSRVANQLSAVRVTGLDLKTPGASVVLPFVGTAGMRIKPVRLTVHIASTNGVVAGDGNMNIGLTPGGSEVRSGYSIGVTDAKKWDSGSFTGGGVMPPMPADTTVWYFTLAGADTGAATICLADIEVQYDQF